MQCDETTLRDMLTALHGQSCGRWILDLVAGGTDVVIRMIDGRTLELNDNAAAAAGILRTFGWTPVP
jgi:hypothetical protein